MDPIQSLAHIYELVSSNFALYWALHVNEFRDGAIFTLTYSLVLVPMAALFIYAIYHDDVKCRWATVLDKTLQVTAFGGLFVITPLLLILLLITPGTQQALHLLDANANIKYDVQLKSTELIEKLPDSVSLADKYLYLQADILRGGFICGAIIPLVLIGFAAFLAACWHSDLPEDDPTKFAQLGQTISAGRFREKPHLLIRLATIATIFYVIMLICLLGVLFFPSTKTLILLHLYGS